MRNIGKALIVGVVVAEAVFAIYLLSPKNERTTNATDNAALVPTQSVGGRIAPEPGPSTEQADQQSVQKTPPHQQLTQAPVPVENPGLVDSKPVAVPPSGRGRGRDSPHRHDSNPVASAMTDQLVKESAQLDPALPPPDPTMPPLRDDQSESRRGANPVAAAMTSQLVRESAKLDPALPPPNASGTR